MRLHTDILTHAQIHSTVQGGLPGVDLTSSSHGSRSHRYAYEVSLTGNGSSATQYKSMPHGELAATWDEWGVFLGRLYVLDPEMICGTPRNPIYAGADHYHWTTGNRFTVLGILDFNPALITLPADTHKRHRWDYVGTCVTGSYHVHACKGSKGKPCSAIKRYVAHGRNWSEISGADHVTAQLVDQYSAPVPTEPRALWSDAMSGTGLR